MFNILPNCVCIVHISINFIYIIYIHIDIVNYYKLFLKYIHIYIIIYDIKKAKLHKHLYIK